MNPSRLLLALIALLGAAVLGFVLMQGAERPVEGSGDRADQSILPLPRRAPATQAETDVAGSLGEPTVRARAIAANNLGVELMEEGRLDEAIDELERALELLPEEPSFAANLAEGLVRRALATREASPGAVEEALADLERAYALDPAREDLLPLIERWSRDLELGREFTTYTSQHFELAFDGDRLEILQDAQSAIDVLEEAYGEFWLLFQHDLVAARGERLGVSFYEPEQFRQVTGLGHWAGGAFDGVLRLPIEDFEAERGRWTRTLRHELAHAFLADLGGRDLPGWLNEGLAQWLEGDPGADLAYARRVVGPGDAIDLELLSRPLSSLPEQTVPLAYAQSLLFTNYLFENYGEATLGAMVRASGEGQRVAEGFETHIGVPLEPVFEDFRAGLDR